MNFWHEHVGRLLQGGGAGLGVTFAILFKDMIRDTWNAILSKFRQGRSPAMIPVMRESDRLGAEITHQLVALLTQDLADRKTAEEKNWTILNGLLNTVTALTSSVSALNQQANSQTTLMQVIASRHQ